MQSRIQRGGLPKLDENAGTDQPAKGSDPWSDQTWGENALNSSVVNEEFTVNLNADLFSPLASIDQEDTQTFLFPSNPIWDSGAVGSNDQHQQAHTVTPIVQVAIHEQLAAIYDHIAEEPTFRIEGSIHVKSSKKTPVKSPFCLLIRDSLDRIETLEMNKGKCVDISENMPRKDLRASDRELRVDVSESPTDREIPVATYTCVPNLRPVPLLVKSRVLRTDRSSHIGFKIRANPQNKYPLLRMVIMIAVPPCVDGPSVKMSKEGGCWDEMKRTISWIVDSLSPGEALDIQTQFEATEGSDQEPTFPVMIRCEGSMLFSGIEINANVHCDAPCQPIEMKLHETVRILHRKI